jgi:hypothetical protein
MKNIIIVVYLSSSMATPCHCDYVVPDGEHRGHQVLNQQNTHPNCDEDITNMDTPIVVAYNSKVKLFLSIIIFNTCDEWTLHHDMCSMSFTEVLTWIKEGVDHAWKGWIMKNLDWGPNPSAPYASTRSPRYLWYKEIRRPSLIRFGNVDSDSRNSPHQNHHRYHIWTPFWTFFIWMER